jgi:hypothetical protein
MIQIDDSGWGSLLGGVMVGVYDTDSDQLYSRLIPVSFFQRRKFENQDYTKRALQIAQAGIQLFTNYPDDSGIHIQVCRGYVLSEVRDWIERNCSHYTKIEYVDIKDPLQSALEAKFSKSLEKIGVPAGKSGGAHRISFNDMLSWIKEDPTRIKHVKTGWKSWNQKYAKEFL